MGHSILIVGGGDIISSLTGLIGAIGGILIGFWQIFDRVKERRSRDLAAKKTMLAWLVRGSAKFLEFAERADEFEKDKVSTNFFLKAFKYELDHYSISIKTLFDNTDRYSWKSEVIVVISAFNVQIVLDNFPGRPAVTYAEIGRLAGMLAKAMMDCAQRIDPKIGRD